MPDQIKHFIKKILNWIHYNISVFRLKLIRVDQGKKIYFIDLDNTLADTWPTLQFKFNSEKERLLAIVPFNAMQGFVNSLYEEGNYVVIISYRSILSYQVSRTWLRRNNISYSLLIIVDDPSRKIALLEKLHKKYPIVFIDDLSYNHENGDVKLYLNLIDRVKDLGISYIGKNRIDKFNSFQSELL